MRILFSKIWRTEPNISQGSGMQNSLSFYEYNVRLQRLHALFLSLLISSSFARTYNRHSLYVMFPSWARKSPGTLRAECTMKHSFVLCTVPWEGTYANYSHRQNISWWHHDPTENFPTPKKNKFLPSFPPPPATRGTSSCCFPRQGVSVEAPPSLCWSHSPACFQRAEISSSCSGPGCSSLFYHSFLIKIFEKLLKIINKEFRANVFKEYTHSCLPSWQNTEQLQAVVKMNI